MNDERRRQVDKVFHDALEQEFHERGSFLDRVCADEPSLRKEVEDLLGSHREAGSPPHFPASDKANGPVGLRGSSALAGRVFGRYELRSLLGSGGMGDVYRARDSELKRDVAIKVLPNAFSRDAECVVRFRREAELLASLNHPNIAAIYDLEASGELRYLVLELVEGETLADRLKRGPFPIDEALRMAKQIAEALEAAHEKGIIHRDLKPANIKMTDAGAVKVLDFGLAKVKALEVDGAAVSPNAATVMMTATRPGMILGTPAYMSPEQARGKVVDKRTDIWAFGCVLYQMLTGHPAFAGGTISDTIVRILERDPDWTALPATTPPAIRRLLQRCLDKDPKRRLHDIADARVEIEDALIEPDSSVTSPTPVRKSPRRIWIAAFVVMIVALVLSVAYYRNGSAEAREKRFQIVTPPGTDLTSFALSPDGLSIVFEAQRQLWLKEFEAESARPLAGTQGGRQPFWKPDSQSIGFFARGELKVIDVSSGIIQALAVTPTSGSGTWSKGGIILFSPSNTGPLSRVPEGGGKTLEVTRIALPHTNHRFPQFLPDDRHFLFFARGTPESQGVYLGSLDSTESRRLFAADSAAVFAPPDYAIFARQGVLLAQRLNLATLEPDGDPSPVAGLVGQNGNFAGNPAVSASAAGPIAYQTEGRARQLIWLDRSGQQVGPLGSPDAFQQGAFGIGLSSDGTLAVSRTVNGNTDIWLIEPGRKLQKFTSDLAADLYPVWSPKRDRIAFASDRTGILDLYEAPINGNGAATLLVESSESKRSLDWSRDGRFFLFTSQNPKTDYDLWVKPLFGDKKLRVVANTTSVETGGRFSPDSHWITYESNESGRMEIYVQPFPGPGRKLPISSDGGINARWSSDGREVFYQYNGRLMVVRVTPGASLRPEPAKELFAQTGEFIGTSPDDQQFLFNTFVESAVPIHILLNWKPPSQ